MKPRKADDIIAVLKQKGFRQTSSHHKYLYLYVNDAATEIYTFISHGLGEYGNDLLSKVKKQLGFSNTKQFEDFLNCPMSYQEYLQMLYSSNKITPPSKNL